MTEPSEVEGRFEERYTGFYTRSGNPIQGELRDDWFSDTHQVSLKIDVTRWPRDGKEWNALARFILHVDNTFRDWLDNHAEIREREGQDDIPF